MRREAETFLVSEETIRRNFEQMRDRGPRWIAHTPLFRKARYDGNWLGDAETPECYETLLPKIDSQTVVAFIDGQVRKLRAGEKLRILDVGCWTAEALSECLKEERWKGKLSLTGITAQIPEQRKEDLSQKGIRIEVKDAHNLAGVFAREKFDLVMSCGALGCMTHQARVISQIWEVLTEGGVALISGAYWPKEKTDELKVLNHYLKWSGYKVRFDHDKWTTLTNRKTGEVFAYLHIVMKKNTPRQLSLPLRPVGYGSFRSDCPEILRYEVDVKPSPLLHLPFLSR